MKVLIFVAASAGYAVLLYVIYLAIMLQCGFGPDSSVTCNDSADRQAFSFAVGALVFYAILSFAYWRHHWNSKS